jgi:hypothetical protein
MQQTLVEKKRRVFLSYPFAQSLIQEIKRKRIFFSASKKTKALSLFMSNIDNEGFRKELAQQGFSEEDIKAIKRDAQDFANQTRTDLENIFALDISRHPAADEMKKIAKIISAHPEVTRHMISSLSGKPRNNSSSNTQANAEETGAIISQSGYRKGPVETAREIEARIAPEARKVLFSLLVKEFTIEDLSDRYRLHNVRWHGGCFTIDIKKELLENGQAYNQDEWLAKTIQNEWKLPPISLYYSCLCALIEAKKSRDKQKKKAAKDALAMLKEDFREPAGIMSSTSVTKAAGGDIVQHYRNYPGEYTFQANLTSGSGDYLKGFLSTVLKVIFETKDLEAFEEIFTSLLDNRIKIYFSITGDAPQAAIFRQRKLIVSGVQSAKARGYIIYRSENFIANPAQQS